MLTRAQLDAARSAAAVGPVLAPAFLRFAGKDARSFLHRMSTQELEALRPGQAAYTAFLNVKGRLLADGQVLSRGDDVLVAVHPGAAAGLREHLERHVIMDDVVVEDGPPLRVLPVLGPDAPSWLEGRAPGALRVPNGRRGAAAVDLWLPAGEAEALRASLAGDGLPALDEGELEAVRIAGGAARFGVDVDGSRLPMEAGLTRSAISFTKGCYLGQEIVLRATARGQLQRGLVQLSLPASAAPGSRLRAGGAEAGVVTSAAETPDGTLGLGYVRRAHWREGERLETDGGEAVVKRVLVDDGIPG